MSELVRLGGMSCIRLYGDIFQAVCRRLDGCCEFKQMTEQHVVVFSNLNFERALVSLSDER
jgi:hypothetical protein